ncbi:hypothetical protein HNQ59_001342 [Chitinivorax tropicus]|uniref:AMMECR1 domain-containing protein n=1 Tax=Chitinivorax tropicus TaxID=714531 RepID=A0A840MMA2_9PROT|nr:AmmeMemoRadiSam system protein A [Chitinivorax tropicus]MBB5018057.1 hypothetical protein [Chitinivorax tropicus]
MLDERLGTLLLALAREAIVSQLGQSAIKKPDTQALSRPGACFITLKRQGALRGCMGSLEAHQSLAEDIIHNAVAAALHDPRFPPVSIEELGETTIEVSVLTAPEPVTVANEAELLAMLRPGVDGVTLRCGCRQATFLPQVWEQLPAPTAFIQQLKRKAGWSADFWSPDMIVTRYQVQKFTEPPLR